MKVVKNQDWYEIEVRNSVNGRNEYINAYPIKSKSIANVAIKIAENEGKEINLAIDLAKDRVNFFK